MSVSLDEEITNRIETFRKAMNAPCPPFATDGIEETFKSVEKVVFFDMSYQQQIIEISGTAARLILYDNETTLKREYYTFFNSSDWYSKNMISATIKHNEIFRALCTKQKADLEHPFVQSETKAHMEFRAVFCEKWNAKQPKLRAEWEMQKPLTITYIANPN